MSYLFKSLLSFIVGIVLAELSSVFVPIALALVLVIIFVLPERFRFRDLCKYLAIAFFSCILAMQDKADVAIVEKEKSQIYYSLSERIENLELSEESKAVAKGILLGDKQALSRSQKQSVREAGMSHIFAVSGLHIGIIYLVLFWLLSPMRFFGLLKTHRLFVISFVWLYVAVIGFPISSIRAALMLSLAVVSWILARNTDSKHIIASAALIMLLYDTQQLWDIGFQLSFLAALGIILVQPHLKKRNRLVQMFLVTLSAQLMTMPLIAYYFHLVPLFGWVQGFLVIPLLPFLVYVMAFYLFFSSLTFLSYPIDFVSHWLFFVAEEVALFENFCLGGRLLWYPSEIETCVMLALILALFLKRR